METMKPGRELDALVAEKVFAKPGLLCICENPRFSGDPWTGDPLTIYHCVKCRKSADFPCYSTNIAAAWEVVERFEDSGFLLTKVPNTEELNPFYTAIFAQKFCCFGETAAHAICLAALATADVELSTPESSDDKPG